MADPFVAEIRIFPFNFAPRGWAFCNGQLLPISQNTALFSLLGTQYGGDGRTSFALPDLRSRVPIGPGQGPGLTNRVVGDSGGEAAVSLVASQMPAHAHALKAAATGATDSVPSPSVAFAPTATARIYREPTSAVGMGTGTVGSTGGNVPHNNLQPYLTMNYIIALQGIFPPRA